MLTSLKRFLIWRWRKGFKETSKSFFDAAHNAQGDYRHYMPDAAYRPLGLTNGMISRTLLNNKLLFEKVVGQYVPVPPTLAMIERGELFAPPGGAIRSFEALLEYIRTQPVALKPVEGAKGKGVYSLSWQDVPLLDGSPMQLDEVDKLINRLDYYLVVPWIQQADYAAAVFPEAGNSLRLITMRDPQDNHRPFIAAAVQKFGTRSSAPTDNWGRGALFAPIDLKTGVMGSGLEDPERTQGKPVWHNSHPDTGARINGLSVPRWSETITVLLDLLEAMPVFTYVGWDVLMTNEGFYVIEGNPAPGLGALQLARPVLTDPRVRRFAEHYRVIKHQ